MLPEECIKIFAVEDDPTYQKFLEYTLGLNPDIETQIFTTGQECLDNLHLKPSIVTIDYSLPDMSGKELLEKIKAYNSDIFIIAISGQEDVGTAVELLKLGAFDYITKDQDTKGRLLHAINNARNNLSLVNELDQLKQEVSQKYEFNKSIIGNSPAMKQVFSLMEKAVKTNITVSITGETGTGKEVVAKAIHYNSERKEKSFVAVNLAAIPKELVESELFGYEKGAFTGAAARRIGKFEEAQGGTIFLDEIGEMELNLQAKLLRVLQEREVVRIGGNQVTKLDVRVLVATHRDLADEVNSGNFREDLYYRLLGLPIHLPPLRDRGNDIILLARFLLSQFCKDNNMGGLTFAKSAQEKLMKYNFPGNVRELKSTIELAAVMAEGHLIEADDIRFNSVRKEENFILEELTMREYTFRIILHFLKKYDNNVLLVAKKLDIGKSTIYRYLKEIEELDSQMAESNNSETALV
ncbi:sigma-54-dependent transcriptional regulator [Tunicatimonas pelagia]|uniref:sigma-54-dependent transcriptional regulator n=1 Tax=Tunicatimonas pelagia TaxID=931531 RepID=UPI002666780F|nr:sigma-54 dependent transcriptional regulator [Tunicatimonas pelagia]WKN42811.1 sigma-54 dependent transcriptional regulator [Tunicatimonas pelagia]